MTATLAILGFLLAACIDRQGWRNPPPFPLPEDSRASWVCGLGSSWNNHVASCLIGDWGIVVHSWGLRVCLGWWNLCIHWRATA